MRHTKSFKGIDLQELVEPLSIKMDNELKIFQSHPCRRTHPPPCHCDPHSSDEEQDLIEGYKIGANFYVRKPVDFNQFVEAVQQLGLYWLILNEAPPPWNEESWEDLYTY